MKNVITILCSVAVFLATPILFSQSGKDASHKEFIKFFTGEFYSTLKTSSQTKDFTKLSDMIVFPLSVNVKNTGNGAPNELEYVSLDRESNSVPNTKEGFKQGGWNALIPYFGFPCSARQMTKHKGTLLKKKGVLIKYELYYGNNEINEHWKEFTAETNYITSELAGEFVRLYITYDLGSIKYDTTLDFVKLSDGKYLLFRCNSNGLEGLVFSPK